MINRIEPTGVELTFGEDEIIVSKTDPQGRITYANDVFIRLAGFTEEELLGAPHNVIRHPAMPRCVFKLLWDTIESGREIFAYVVNMSRNGDHYWVLAHVTPSFDANGRIVGYHSNRRCPSREAISRVQDLYRDLLAAEARLPKPKEAALAGEALLRDHLGRIGLDYPAFVWSLDSVAAGGER